MAIVHDYLNQPGGAERVVLAMATIWPDAPIYTSLYRAGSTFPGFGAANVQISALHWLPVDRGFRNLFPLYPAAFRSFGPLQHDVVISSSSGWAHSVRTGPQTFHVVYCYTPARWLYGGEYLGADRRKLALRPFLSRLRSWDRHAAGRADLYIAIARRYGAASHIATASTRRSSIHPSTSTGSARARAASGCWWSRGCCRTNASTRSWT